MPFKFYCEAPGVYRTEWHGIVEIKEVIEGAHMPVKQADKDKVDEYVSVIDLTHATRLPFDIGNLRRLVDIDERRIAFIIIHASYGAQLINRIVSTFINYEMYFTDTPEEAIEKARSLLIKYKEEKAT